MSEDEALLSADSIHQPIKARLSNSSACARCLPPHRLGAWRWWAVAARPSLGKFLWRMRVFYFG